MKKQPLLFVQRLFLASNYIWRENRAKDILLKFLIPGANIELFSELTVADGQTLPGEHIVEKCTLRKDDNMFCVLIFEIHLLQDYLR